MGNTLKSKSRKVVKYFGKRSCEIIDIDTSKSIIYFMWSVPDTLVGMWIVNKNVMLCYDTRHNTYYIIKRNVEHYLDSDKGEDSEKHTWEYWWDETDSLEYIELLKPYVRSEYL